MIKSTCPYCKEYIKAKVVICKHCGSRLQYDRREMIMSEIMRRIEKSPFEINKGPVSAYTAWCYGMYGNNKVLLNQCLQDSRGAAAIAAMAEFLHKELIVTFHDIVWGGGDIDPKPFEMEVRKRFSRPTRKARVPREGK